MFGRGDASTRDASFEAAIANYRQALRLRPNDYHAYWNLGWVFYLSGDYGQAIGATEQVLKLAPLREFGSRLVLVTNLLGLGKREEGIAECRKAIDYAAAHPLSSDAYYFRQAIRNAERLQAVRPQDGLQEVELLLKQSFVFLQYRGTPQPGPTSGQLSNLAFGAPTVERGGKPTSFWLSDTFPADTEQVNMLFDYRDMADGEQVVLKVYFNGVEQPFFNQVVTWEGGQSGHSDQLAVEVPVERTLFGLMPGRYRVEVCVEGNLRASGEFAIENS